MNGRLSWTELNNVLRRTHDEHVVWNMFQEERQRPKPNKQWMRRIWSRYTFLRKKRELKELKLI